MVATFALGQSYTRADIADIIAMPPERRGGSWDTGYDEWQGEVFIFANIGVAGRTGHDYQNCWRGKELIWYGKNRSRRGQTQMDRIISNSVPVHIFWRGADRSPFTYAGIGMAIEATDDAPIRVVWSFDQLSETSNVALDPERSRLPVSRRGPPPHKGDTLISRVDGQTYVYVLRLDGAPRLLPDLPEDHVVIKVGISNEIDRRLRELNAGFPPGSKASWVCVACRLLPTSLEAYQLEGERLEHLRKSKRWIGGEYGMIPEADVATVLG